MIDREALSAEIRQLASEKDAVVIAHNYQRDHEMNMWFVLATETADQLTVTLHNIEQLTGIPVFNLPKQEEFFVGLHLQV